MLIKEGKSNIKYLLIVVILAVIVGGGILSWIKKQEVPPAEFPGIEKPEKIVEKKEICFKGELKGSITRYIPFVKEISDELKKTIIDRITEDIEDKLGLSKEELCKAKSITLEGKTIDLNTDGTWEYIIFPQCLHFNGTFTCIPGTGGGPMYVFGFIQDKWKLIGEVSGNSIQEMKSRQTKGYTNLVTITRIGAAMSVIDEYAWNGERYELIKTVEYGEGTSNPLGPPEEYLELWEGQG